MSGQMPVSDVLRAAGFDTLGNDPPMEAIGSVLRALGGLLNGADPLDRELVRAAAFKRLRGVGIHAPAKMLDAALKQPEADDPDTVGAYDEPPEVVDVVDAGEAGLAFVVVNRGEVEVVDEWQGVSPWPRDKLPYKESIPHVMDYQAAVDAGAMPVADELAARIKGAVVLPNPQQAWAYLLAAWDHGTYLLSSFDYFPLLLLEGPPERGKTRLAKFITYASRRGYYTATPRGPTLVRDRAFHQATLMVDVEDLKRVLERGGELADLLLASFERGAQVRLVVRPDAAPEDMMESYAAYGATLLLSNKAVRTESPLASRCIRIALPEAGTADVPPSARPEDLLDLRAKMIAWAARIRAGGVELPEVEVPFRGRLRDMALPLLRVLKLIAPDHVDEVINLLQAMDASRRADSLRSWEARVAIAITAAKDKVAAGRLYLYDLVPIVNDGLSEAEHLDERQIGTARRQLGLIGGKGGDPPRAFITWPGDEVVDALRERYSPLEDPGRSEGSEGTEGTGSAGGPPDLPTSGKVGRVGRDENRSPTTNPSDLSNPSAPLQDPVAGYACTDCGADVGRPGIRCARCEYRKAS
jgi:hypothetical protein